MRSPRRTVRWGAVAALALAATALASCGQSGDSGGDGESATGFPRTVEHAMGETEIERQPDRVIALDNSYVDATLALETPVVGYTTFTAGGVLPDYLAPHIRRHAPDAESVGVLTEPGIEKMAQLSPDLILSAKVRHEDGYDQFSGMAPTVFSETTGSTWKENLRLAAEALGKEDLARRKLGQYETRAEKIGNAIRAKEGGNPTVSVVRFAGEPTARLYTADSFIGVVINQDVGLSRPKDAPTADDISVDIPQERIADVDADHLFVASYQDGTGDSASQRQEFTNNPLWDRLEGAEHNVDDGSWISSVGLLGAHQVLDDLAEIFGVDPAKEG